MPQLSIITINLNNKEGLQKTIESVICQTSPNFEYIIIDGGSNDGSLELIKEYADKITQWVSEADKGIYNAMNKGISYAKGEHICFLNSGDEYNSIHSIESAIHKISEHHEFCWIYIFDYIYASSNGLKILVSSKDVTNKVRIFVKGFGHPSTFYRKEIFDRIGLFDESYKISADRELYLRALLKFNLSFKYFSLPISIFNEGGISTSIKYKNLLLYEDREIQRNYFSSWERKLFKSKIFQGLNKIPIIRALFNNLFNWGLSRK